MLGNTWWKPVAFTHAPAGVGLFFRRRWAQWGTTALALTGGPAVALAFAVIHGTALGAFMLAGYVSSVALLLTRPVRQHFRAVAHAIDDRWPTTRGTMAVGLSLALTCLLVEPFLDAKSEREKVCASGGVLDYREMTPRPVPDGLNAAPRYERVFEAMRTGSDEESGAVDAFVCRDPQISGEADRELVMSVLTQNARALALLREAVALPQCQFPTNWARAGLDAPSSPGRNLRESARLLVVAALMHKEEGDVDQAVGSCRAILRIADHLGKELPQETTRLLVRIAVIALATTTTERILCDADTSARQYRALLEEFCETDLRGDLAQALRGDRAWVWTEAFHKPRRGKHLVRVVATDDKPFPIPGLNYWEARPGLWRLAREEATYLHHMAYAISLADQESWEASSVYSIRERAMQAASKLCTMTAPILYLCPSTFQKVAQATALVDTTRLALALRLYRLDHGHYPDSLTALTPDYVRAGGTDPYSGDPYRYRKEGDGFVVYSVGEGGVDDGGREEYEYWKSGDIAWRSYR